MKIVLVPEQNPGVHKTKANWHRIKHNQSRCTEYINWIFTSNFGLCKPIKMLLLNKSVCNNFQLIIILLEVKHTR